MTVWKVVGGGTSGGILVRNGVETSSAQASERLSTGALVEELQLEGERLQYELLEGSGPHTGWVSLKLKGQSLLVKQAKKAAAVATVKPAQDTVREAHNFCSIIPSSWFPDVPKLEALPSSVTAQVVFSYREQQWSHEFKVDADATVLDLKRKVVASDPREASWFQLLRRGSPVSELALVAEDAYFEFSYLGPPEVPNKEAATNKVQDVRRNSLGETLRRSAEEEARRQADDAAAKKNAEEAEVRRKAEEEAARRSAEEEARRKADEEAAKNAAEEAETRRKAEEEEAKRKADEEAARKAAEEAEARRHAEEEAARRASEEEAKRKADEEAATKAAEEAEARRHAEEAARRAAEDEDKRKADEEAARKAAEEAEVRRKAEEEAATRAAEEEARRKADEEASRQAAEEAEARRKAAEELANAEEEAKCREREEAARKEAEALAPKELLIEVHIDRELNFKTSVRVMEGSTIADVRIALAAADPTGQVRVEDIALSAAGSEQVLDDSVLVTERLLELDLC